jgi:hypothetical protein
MGNILNAGGIVKMKDEVRYDENVIKRPYFD